MGAHGFNTVSIMTRSVVCVDEWVMNDCTCLEISLDRRTLWSLVTIHTRFCITVWDRFQVSVLPDLNVNITGSSASYTEKSSLYLPMVDAVRHIVTYSTSEPIKHVAYFLRSASIPC